MHTLQFKRFNMAFSSVSMATADFCEPGSDLCDCGIIKNNVEQHIFKGKRAFLHNSILFPLNWMIPSNHINNHRSNRDITHWFVDYYFEIDARMHPPNMSVPPYCSVSNPKPNPVPYRST